MADCMFCDMAQGKMEVEKLYEDDLVFSIRDKHPRTPIHMMVIPKQHIATALDISPRTAEAHRRNLLRKFEVGSTKALMGLLGHSGGATGDGHRSMENH